MRRQHKHAALIQQWLDDDSLEVEGKNGLGKWVTVCNNQVNWNAAYEYRIKPKMIKCGDLEFPEPMQVAPEIDDLVWLTTLVGPEPVQWSDNPVKEHWLKLGLIHATKEAAEAHARALIALTEVKP